MVRPVEVVGLVVLVREVVCFVVFVREPDLVMVIDLLFWVFILFFFFILRYRSCSVVQEIDGGVGC